MIPGRVIVFNGASSSGKTTIAQAVRDRRGPNCTAVSIDQFYASIHSERENNWSLFYSLTEILFASVAAFANRGFDVVVDSVFERPLGLARNQSDRIHDDCVHDLVMDTSELSVAECATRILELFDASEWPAQTTMLERAGREEET